VPRSNNIATAKHLGPGSGIAVAVASAAAHNPWGRGFWFSPCDVLIIGGGLSLLIGGLLYVSPQSFRTAIDDHVLWPAILLVNSAHFAASYIRVYTKPKAMERLPALSFFGPAALFLVTLICISYASILGRHLTTLYLTWSPYHYAAQTFGLSLIYLYRSGCTVSRPERRLLKCGAFAPFMWAFIDGRKTGTGLGWFLSAAFLNEHQTFDQWLTFAQWPLAVISLLAPIALVMFRWRKQHKLTPLIVPTLLLSNAIWWILFPYIQAFLWATVFHGLQYLGIVLAFHIHERVGPSGTVKQQVLVGARFYVAAAAIGYALFRLWGYSFQAAGFGYAESSAIIVASLNIYHFIVDAYVWKLRGDSNEAVLRYQS
jgi:hypothetical protein